MQQKRNKKIWKISRKLFYSFSRIGGALTCAVTTSSFVLGQKSRCLWILRPFARSSFVCEVVWQKAHRQSSPVGSTFSFPSGEYSGWLFAFFVAISRIKNSLVDSNNRFKEPAAKLFLCLEVFTQVGWG